MGGEGPRKAPVVRNKDTILADVDLALDMTSPPSVEYLYVPPRAQYTIRRIAELFGGHSDSYANPYGHAAIRYTLPCGEEKVRSSPFYPRSPSCY